MKDHNSESLHDVEDLQALQSQGKEILSTRTSHEVPRDVIAIIPDTVDASRAEAWFVRAKSVVRRVFGETSDFYKSLVKIDQPTHYSCYNQALAIINGATDEVLLRIKRAAPSSSVDRDSVGNSVFIVHGHDDGTKQTVARFLERLKLHVVILHEQPNKGRTIMEKLDEHSLEARFAVVLLTPDDVGGEQSESPPLNPRARQNVVFEHGFFVGILGRTRVVALRNGDVEIPSDLNGLAYVDMTGRWQLDLAREMKAAGLPIDMNDAI